MVTGQDDWRDLRERAAREHEEQQRADALDELTSDEIRDLAALIAQFRRATGATEQDFREAGL